MDERTPFYKVSDGAPSYVYMTNPHRLYKKQVRQFQCFICSAILGIFLTALIITITVSVDNDIEDFPPDSPAENNSSLEALLSLSFPLKDGGVPDWSGPALSAMEVDAAEAAGLASLVARDRLEADNIPLSADSPSYRHQQSTKTSADATRLARAGYAVGVATHTLAMKHSGGSSVGHGLRLSAEWLPNEVCGNGSASRCEPIPYRSIDGSCNNMDHPAEWGVAMRPFRRVLDPDYADGVSAPRVAKDGSLLPSAREVSVTVHRPEYRDDPQFTVMLAVWGQFMDHDLTATALSQGHGGKAISCCHSETIRLHPECYPVRLSEGDPFYHQYNISCMEFVRSAPAPSCSLGPREQLNQVSSYLDASVIYGSVTALSRGLRTFQNGRLRMSQSPDGRPLLPISTDLQDGCNRLEENRKGQYCFISGDARANENLHLTSLHLLMARQHNRLAARLGSLNPDWADERLYQEARRIVSAQMQHITYNEFLPVLLGPELMLSLDLDARQVGYYDDYNSSVNPTISNNFATAAFRFAHTLLPGLMKMLANDTSSDEFMELHQMLFNPYSLYKPGQLDKVLRGAMGTNIERADNYFNKEVTERLFAANDRPTTVENAKKPCGLDLVSLNVQRGRDHGLPGYPVWRQHCGLPRPANFDDLDGQLDPDSLQRMRNLYKSVDDVDLYTGALSEIPVSGGMLGPTVTCLIADQFKRLKVGDRYWYETPQQPQAFTPDQLNEIRKTSLAGIICDNADAVSVAQPYVMRSVSESNQRMNCSSLPHPDFTLWAQTREANCGAAYARLGLVVKGGKVSTAEGVDLWSGALPLVLPVAVFDASDTSSYADLKIGILWSGTISIMTGVAALNGSFSFPQYIQDNTVNYTTKWINGEFSFVSNVLWNDTASESIQLSGTYETPVFLSERAEYNKVKLSDFNDKGIVYKLKKDTFDEMSLETSGLKSPIILLGSFSSDKISFYWHGEAILSLPQSTNNPSANLQQEISMGETDSLVAESKVSGMFTVVGGNMKIIKDGSGPVASWSGALPVSVPLSLFYDTAMRKVLFPNADTKQIFGHGVIWSAYFSGSKLEGSFSLPQYSRNGSNFSVCWITGEFSFNLKPSENTTLEKLIKPGVKYSSRVMFSETSPHSVTSSRDDKSSNIGPEPELSESIARFIDDAQGAIDGAISAPIILKGTFSPDKSTFSWNGDVIVKVQETKPKLAKQRVLLNTPNPAFYPWHYNRIGAAIVDGEILVESKMIWSGSLPAEISLAAFWNPGIQPSSKEVFSDGIIWSGSATESIINGTFLLAQYSRNEASIKWLPGTFSLLMRPLWFSPWANTIVPGLKYYSRIFFQGSKSFVDPRLSHGQSTLSQRDDAAVWAPIILQGSFSPDRTTFYWSGNVIVSIRNGPTHYYQLNAPQPQLQAVLRKDASDAKKASIEVTVTTGSLSIGAGNSTMTLWSGSLPATIHLDSLISPSESQWSPFSQSSRVVWSGTISGSKVEGIFAIPKYTMNGSVPVTEWVSGKFSVDTAAKWGASLEKILKTGQKYTFKVFFRKITKSGSQIDHSTDLLLRLAGDEKNSLVSLITESQNVIDDSPVGNLVLLGTFYEKSFYCSLLTFLCSNEKLFYWNGGAYVSVESSPKDTMQLSSSGSQEKQFAGSVVSGSIQAGLGNESIVTVWSGTTPSAIPLPIFWAPVTYISDEFSGVFSHGITWTGSVLRSMVEGSFSLPQTVWDGTSYSTRQWNGNFSFKFKPLWNASLGNLIQPGLKYHSKIILQGSNYVDDLRPFTQGFVDHGDIESLWAPIILQGSYSPDHKTFYWTGMFIIGFKTHPKVESAIKYLPLPKQILKKDDSKKPPKKPADSKKPVMATVNFSVQSGKMSIYNASGEPSQIWSGELPATIHIDTLLQSASYGPPSANVIWSGSAIDSMLSGTFTMPTYVQNGTDLLTIQLSGNFSFKFTVKYAASVTAVLKPDKSYSCKVLFKEKKKLTSKALDKAFDPQHAVQLMLAENPNKSDESGMIILFGEFYERPFYCTLLPFLCSDEKLFYWGGDAIVKVSNPSSQLSSTPSAPTIDTYKIITTHVKTNLTSKSTILESKTSSTADPNITDEIFPPSEKLMLEMNSSSAVFPFRQHVCQGSVNSGHLSAGESGSSLDDLWAGTFPVNISLPAFWTPSPATTDPDVDAYSQGIIWSAQIFQSTVQGMFSLQKHRRSGPISINQWWEGHFSFHVEPVEEGFSLFDFIIPGVNYYSPMGFRDFKDPPIPTNYLGSPSQIDINSAIRAPIIMYGTYSADRRMFFWSGKFAIVFSKLPNPYM